LFRAVCGQSLDVSKTLPELTVDVARCLYGVDAQSVEEVERFLRRQDVELVKTVAWLKHSGRYPWLYARSWLISQKKEKVAGVVGINDPTKSPAADQAAGNDPTKSPAADQAAGNDPTKGAERGIRRYDLFPLIFRMIFVESEEGGEEGVGGPDFDDGKGDKSHGVVEKSQSVEEGKEERHEGVGTSQIYHVTMFYHDPHGMVNPPSPQDTNVYNAEERRFTETNTHALSPNGKNGKNFVETPSTQVTEAPSPGEMSKPVEFAEDTVVIHDDALRPIVEAAAKERRAPAEEVWEALHKALEYFEVYRSVGSIRAVEDLRRLSKASEAAVKAALDVLREVGLVEYINPGVYNYRAAGLTLMWRYKAKKVLERI